MLFRSFISWLEFGNCETIYYTTRKQEVNRLKQVVLIKGRLKVKLSGTQKNLTAVVCELALK